MSISGAERIRYDFKWFFKHKIIWQGCHGEWLIATDIEESTSSSCNVDGHCHGDRWSGSSVRQTFVCVTHSLNKWVCMCVYAIVNWFVGPLIHLLTLESEREGERFVCTVCTTDTHTHTSYAVVHSKEQRSGQTTALRTAPWVQCQMFTGGCDCEGRQRDTDREGEMLADGVIEGHLMRPPLWNWDAVRGKRETFLSPPLSWFLFMAHLRLQKK